MFISVAVIQIKQLILGFRANNNINNNNINNIIIKSLPKKSLSLMAAGSETLKLAAEERANQGIHELEISFGGELDLHKHYNHCQKNPGHHNFIPMDKLGKSHLPKYLKPWVQRVSGFTVKLAVNYVSPNRPPGYPLSDRAGQRILSAGSGYVVDFPATGNNNKLPCPFTNCGELPGDHDVYGYITVVTAAHVVFDDEEAKNTTVEFFYDNPVDRSCVVIARGVKVAASSVEGDFCELLCVTHDGSLCRRLNDLQRYRSDSTVKLSVNYVSPNRPAGNPFAGHRVLSVGSGHLIHTPAIVSYVRMKCPFKHCGELAGVHEVYGYITVVTAAHVVFDDEEAKSTTVEFLYDDSYGMRGVVTARGFRVAPSSVEGDCELLCVTHNISLFQLLNDIQRYKSDSTVKLSVNYVSPNRPHRYPLSDHAGQRVLSVGSGYLTDSPNGYLRMECPFTNCDELPGNHDVFGYTTVLTTAHVVFDDEEAQNTTVEFFYNDPDGRRLVVTARGVKVAHCSFKGVFCELLCVIHDLCLFQRLDERNICNFFLNILPALKSAECVAEKDLKFLFKIKLNNPSEALEALGVLLICTKEVVDRSLTYFSYFTNSFREVLKSIRFTTQDLITEDDLELRRAEFTMWSSTTIAKIYLEFLIGRLKKYNKLAGLLRDSYSSSINLRSSFFILKSELAQYFSTVESLEERVSLLVRDMCHIYIPGNRLEVVNISNGTATVEVSLSRSRYGLRGTGFSFLSVDDESNADMLIVHIGHPHGQSKQVTIGRQTDCFTGDGFYHQLYTAPTCPGCSGGPVWMIPASRDLSQVYGVPHSGHHGNELNKGGSWTMYPHES